MPHLAKIAVIPAKSTEANMYRIHISLLLIADTKRGILRNYNITFAQKASDIVFVCRQNE